MKRTTKKNRSIPGLIHGQSGKTDFGTPIEIVNAARLTMGGIIDLDVASAPYWNKRIKARRYFHIFRAQRRWDGRPHPLDLSWRNLDGSPARVWMNHPYGRRGNVLWVEKLLEEFRIGNVVEALALTWAEQSTGWGKMLRAFPRWIPDRRISHLDRNGRQQPGNVKGSMVTYIAQPQKWGNFYETFKYTVGGSVDIPAEYHFDQIAEFAAEHARRRLAIISGYEAQITLARQGAVDHNGPKLWIEGQE